MTISNPLLISTLALLVAIPISLWISRRTSKALREHDAALDRVDFDRVAASVAPVDCAIDPLSQIEALLVEEVVLIRTILDERTSGVHASHEHVTQLRTVHRRGLAVRQRCGDPALDAELSWLQGYGSLALMVDLSEFDRSSFDRELNFRAAEVSRALVLRRGRMRMDTTEATPEELPALSRQR